MILKVLIFEIDVERLRVSEIVTMGHTYSGCIRLSNNKDNRNDLHLGRWLLWAFVLALLRVGEEGCSGGPKPVQPPLYGTGALSQWILAVTFIF